MTRGGCSSYGAVAKPVWDSEEAGEEHIQSQGTKCAPLEFVAESEDNDCKHGEICSEKSGKRVLDSLKSLLRDCKPKRKHRNAIEG